MRLVLLILPLVTYVIATTKLAAAAGASGANAVTIRRMAGGAVEVEVSSAREFPVLNSQAVLSIGKASTGLSRSPKDGSPHVLIFTLTAEAFSRTRDGDAITVHYEPESQEPWDFGQLVKARVEDESRRP